MPSKKTGPYVEDQTPTTPGTEETPAPRTVPHVYRAIHKILGSLSVDKDGMLPNNMGGKSYATAENISNEVKRLFVENNLVLVPNETYYDYEVNVDGNGRKTVFVSVEGRYRIVSAEDQSQVTISGVGDGIATGTAVASNIASTFALKNALLRTFLITQSSVETSGLTDQNASGTSATQQKINGARQPQAPATPTRRGQSPTRSKIGSYISTGKIESSEVNTRVAAAADALKKPKGDEAVLTEVLNDLISEFGDLD